MIFKKKSNMSTGKNIFTLILIIIIFGGVFYIVNTSKVSVEPDKVKVSGLYGLTIKYNDIQEVSLKESLPQNLIRTNGIDFLGAYLGNFKGENMDKIKMFVKSKSNPSVYIKTKNNEYLIFNTKDQKETEALFNDIKAKVNK